MPVESDRVWAPVHAWRALGQLRAAEATPSLARPYDRPGDATDHVDLSVPGDVEEVEILLGLRSRRATRQPRAGMFTGERTAGDAEDPWPFRGLVPWPPVGRVAKVGRSDPSPCGSGKKFKKCRLNLQ